MHFIFLIFLVVLDHFNELLVLATHRVYFLCSRLLFSIRASHLHFHLFLDLLYFLVDHTFEILLYELAALGEQALALWIVVLAGNGLFVFLRCCVYATDLFEMSVLNEVLNEGN